jgi:internalin A
MAFKDNDPTAALAEAERRIKDAECRHAETEQRIEKAKQLYASAEHRIERAKQLTNFAELEAASADLQAAEQSRRNAEQEGANEEELVLSELGIAEVPPSLMGLTHLRELDLGGNQLRKLPASLGGLKQLQRLNLVGNQLCELPVSLGELKKLREVQLSNNQLRGLPVSFGGLKQLQVLRLDGNQLRELPASLGELEQLQTLYLSDNQLGELPTSIGKLKQLRELRLDGNDLHALPSSCGGLDQLQVLRLDGNQLRELPGSLSDLKQLKWLWLDGNRELLIPEEIVGTHDARKILEYYFLIRGRGAAQPLNEFKLILVGRGGVGKTTLVHRLVTGKYEEFKRTPGINITQWPLKIDGEEVQAHVWDFGGQEIMHGTHRFFMTARALYLVLITSRESTEDHDAEYWLSLVRSFAGDDAPVIVLLHKWGDARFELNRELLREKFGRGLVFIETDSESSHGIAALYELVCELAKALPGLKAAWPSDWRRVKDELPAAKEKWLSFDDFCAFCRERGVEKREEHEELAEYLHDLGLMLAYRKEEALRGFGVLNPQWITKGIYDMLNAPELKAQNGKFTRTDFEKLLPDADYPAALHPYLLALMRKFRLCFPLDDEGRVYLIPDLLTKEEPKLDAEFPPEQCLGFIYRYESVLPEGLLPRFIVETHVHREPKHAWRTGVVLERANCRALVRGDVLGRTVTIRVTGAGNGQRELLGIIREYFERIHKSFQKLSVTELVPVAEYPNVLIPYAELLAYEAVRDDEYKVVIDRVGFSPSLARVVRGVSVKKLLDGLDLPGMSRELAFARASAPAGVRISKSDSLSVFISYSHKDELFRDELRGALTAYERKGELVVLDDTRVEAGQKWEPEILGDLGRANIIVLLLSNDFIASDYCIQKEWNLAKKRDSDGKCAIVPIVVRACRFDKLELGQLKAILPDGKPIQQSDDRDAAWMEVTKDLDRVIARLKKQRGK